MVLNITCSTYWPTTTACSGHGSCNDFGQCECEEGWSSKGDFITIPGKDCDIHILTLRIIWGWLGGMWTLVLLRAFYGWAILINNLLHSPKRPKNHVYGTYFFIVMTSCCFALSGWLKAVDPVHYSIGNNELYSVVFPLAMALFWAMIPYHTLNYIKYVGKLVKVAESSEKRLYLEGLVEYTKQVFKIGMFVAIIICLVPAICVWDREHAMAYQAIHYVGIGVTLALMGKTCALELIGAIRKDFRKQLENMEELKKSKREVEITYKKIKRLEYILMHMQSNGNQQVVMNIITAILFCGIFPFLSRKSSYQLGIAWGCGSLICFIAMESIPLAWAGRRPTNRIEPLSNTIPTTKAVSSK